MPEEIRARFHWTMEEMGEAARWHLKQAPSWRRRVLLALALFCGGVGAWSYLRPGLAAFAWIWMGGMIYVLLLLVLIRWITIWKTRRNFAKSTLLNAEIEWRISDTALHVQHPRGSSEMVWAVFNTAFLTPAGLLLYPQPAQFQWLPKHAFGTEADYAAVAASARKHIAAFRDVS